MGGQDCIAVYSYTDLYELVDISLPKAVTFGYEWLKETMELKLNSEYRTCLFLLINK